ncbi:MAG: Gfo/Idh/MocA family oxidoreductase [Phycisphaerales bacterium]|nr:MAG: Gfo/Idh/MocA family oxidoreductase [Phycisphaerales bacterium]
MRTVRFGIIGCGMMGREFASAAARWMHLPQMTVRPEIVAICNRTLAAPKIDWFKEHVSTLEQVTSDYRELLGNPDVEAVYVAVPHHLHEEFYLEALESGKHLMGEKPFGIDRSANDAILAGIERHPDCFVRCASQFIFFPAVQKIGAMLEADAFGRIIEVNAGFLHCSDLNPDKRINWKRVLEFNGAYGCLGDLGPHACTVPLRAGWVPLNVRAVLSNIVPERLDDQGRRVSCETWDNATLLCDMKAPNSGEVFPFTLKTQRIAPGQKNNWYIEILGTQASARFSLNEANALDVLEYEPGGEQTWGRINMGHEVAYRSITSEIFQFGVPDAILQMWAAFLYELEHGDVPSSFARCVTPAESVLWHRLFTAALQSHADGSTISVT